MSKFDMIIGYSAVKKELLQIADTLKNREYYEKLGVAAPKGLLLYGEPGVGKSLMAAAVIEASGRQAFVCRKDQPNGDFVKRIKETFDQAIENAPSVVLLDDMDKFANGDERHPDAEEYVTVQSCIDNAKGKEVFVIATVNNIYNLPRSLRRAGRFDRVIEILEPQGNDALSIISHYLQNKKVAPDVDSKLISHIMDGRSCAELETVVNAAGTYAGYERAEVIAMDHLLEACLRIVFEVPTKASDGDDSICCANLSDANCESSQIVYHEAGHAVVSELLCPESVTLAYVYHRDRNRGGFVDCYNDRSYTPLYWEKSRILCTLAGMAANEQKYGVADIGGKSDLNKAFREMKALLVDRGVNGLRLHGCRYGDEYSEQLQFEQERSVALEVEKFYKKAKEILALNTEFLEKVAQALATKKLLTTADIQEIKSSCRNDITNMHVNAIVNTANPRPVIGLGVDSVIHEKAGPNLLKARQKIGAIDMGCAAITPAFDLDAKYVIHTVGPVWGGGSYGEENLLRSCYDNSLKLAVEHNCQSIAFPLISTGNYGFPKDKALQIAISAFSSFLLENEMQIYLVVFDRKAFKLSEKLFQSVASYIDQHYVDACQMAVYGAPEDYRRRIRRRDMEICESEVLRECLPCAPMATSKAMSLEEMLKQADAGFTETLLKLIDRTGKKDSEIYKRANISKQHFSKIRNNPNYKPSKPTAIALALALELDLDTTKDLIGRAGYALTNSSKFDLIIRFFIEQGNYNVVEINIALYEFDQSLLGM